MTYTDEERRQGVQASINQDLADAQRVLAHYIVMLMKNAGLRTDSDTVAECHHIVDSIFRAAVAQAKLDIQGD